MDQHGTERDSELPEVRPLDVDGVGVVTAGTVLWVIALLVLLPFTSTLREDGHGWWIGMAAAGTALGVFGIVFCRRRRASHATGRSGST